MMIIIFIWRYKYINLFALTLLLCTYISSFSMWYVPLRKYSVKPSRWTPRPMVPGTRVKFPMGSLVVVVNAFWELLEHNQYQFLIGPSRLKGFTKPDLKKAKYVWWNYNLPLDGTGSKTDVLVLCFIKTFTVLC